MEKYKHSINFERYVDSSLHPALNRRPNDPAYHSLQEALIAPPSFIPGNVITIDGRETHRGAPRQPVNPFFSFNQPEIPFNSDAVITLPRYGIQVLAPDETYQNIRTAKSRAVVTPDSIHWSPEEKMKLQLMKECGILGNRFPTPDEGKKFMESVDYRRHAELLRYATEFSAHIASQWNHIDPNNGIAIIVYGSVARGLVKPVNHESPSDIDLAVIGSFNEDQREELFESVKEKREEIAAQLVGDCPNHDAELWNRYVGLKIQDISKLSNNTFGATLNYIKSGARQLHDPKKIWLNLEQTALRSEIERREEKKSKKRMRQPKARPAHDFYQ